MRSGISIGIFNIFKLVKALKEEGVEILEKRK
jgi:hypothetical protein